MSDVQQVEVTNANRALANLRRAQQGTWTPERIETLKRLHDAKLSASRIAEQLGDGITKNSVVGKLQRLGLARGRPQKDRTKSQPKYLAAGTRVVGINRFQPQRVEILEYVEPPKPQGFIGVTLEGLKFGMCRFPRGEGRDTLFCGQPQKRGSSYCEHCHSICYRGKPPERRRNPDRPRRIRSRYGFEYERMGA